MHRSFALLPAAAAGGVPGAAVAMASNGRGRGRESNQSWRSVANSGTLGGFVLGSALGMIPFWGSGEGSLQEVHQEITGK